LLFLLLGVCILWMWAVSVMLLWYLQFSTLKMVVAWYLESASIN
jgi:hypothetical protein